VKYLPPYASSASSGTLGAWDGRVNREKNTCFSYNQEMQHNRNRGAPAAGRSP